jgi:hypothetical protein
MDREEKQIKQTKTPWTPCRIIFHQTHKISNQPNSPNVTGNCAAWSVSNKILLRLKRPRKITPDEWVVTEQLAKAMLFLTQVRSAVGRNNPTRCQSAVRQPSAQHSTILFNVLFFKHFPHKTNHLSTPTDGRINFIQYFNTLYRNLRCFVSFIYDCSITPRLLTVSWAGLSFSGCQRLSKSLVFRAGGKAMSRSADGWEGGISDSIQKHAQGRWTAWLLNRAVLKTNSLSLSLCWWQCRKAPMTINLTLHYKAKSFSLPFSLFLRTLLRHSLCVATHFYSVHLSV